MCLQIKYLLEKVDENIGYKVQSIQFGYFHWYFAGILALRNAYNVYYFASSPFMKILRLYCQIRYLLDSILGELFLPVKAVLILYY